MSVPDPQTFIDGRVLAYLRRWGQQWPTGREIADSLRRDPAAVRRALARLEKAGLVRRGGTGQDRSTAWTINDEEDRDA